jgi:F-type H+-transporting ATPase subunit alpha
MTEVTELVPDWRARLAKAVHNSAGPQITEQGIVRELSDGVVVVTGLDHAAAEEMLEIDTNSGPVPALALSLSQNEIRCLVLGAEREISSGARVRRTGRVLTVPVGEGFLGRVIDPLGHPLDGGAPVAAAAHWSAEREPLKLRDRAAVRRPMATGCVAIDSLLPLGLGQRQLIIGDRRTGKTTLALQAMVAQSRLGVVVIYASIGQRASATADAISYLRAHGDFAQAIAMVAGPDDAAGLQWLLPFAATTMAEFFVAKGRDVLIVYDDLIKHAAVHRQVSLLLRQAPGREAFPGDIFHLHARLLERAGQLSAVKGGGSLSALAIAELQAGNLTAYIPTNLVSITDGQILMDAKLWQAGHRPAIDIGLSVSRIGGRAQSEAIRIAAGQIRLDYAQYLDLESFVRFGGAVEPKTAARLDHGRRIRACLIQQASEDVSQSGLLALLRAMGTGALDHLAPAHMVDIRQRLTAEIDERAPALKPLLSAGQSLTEAAMQALDAAIVAVAV